MPDYKEMYLTLVRATEKAVRLLSNTELDRIFASKRAANLLIEAQQSCEELYISQPEPELTLLCADEEGPRQD